MIIFFTNVLAVLIGFQLLFVGLFLLFRNGRKISNILLGLFAISIFLNFTDGMLVLQYSYQHFPYLAFIGNNFSLAFGPLLYLYTLSIITRKFKWKSSFYLHFIPLGLFLLFSLVTYHFQSHSMQLYILQQAENIKIPLLVQGLGFMVFVQIFIYLWKSFRLVKRYENNNSDYYSAFRFVDLRWLRSTLILFSFVMALAFFHSFFGSWFEKTILPLSLLLVSLCLFVFITRILLKGLTEPSIFTGYTEEHTETNKAIAIKYADSNLTANDKSRIADRIRIFMKEHKPYFNPELTIEEFAIQLGIKTKELSQILNEVFNQHYFDFINRHRIEEAGRLLITPPDPKVTVLEIIYEVGFNSKSSFNTLFKKYTGYTPTAYKKLYTPETRPSILLY